MSYLYKKLSASGFATALREEDGQRQSEFEEQEHIETEYQIRYLPYNSDEYKIIKGFTSRQEAKSYAKAENFDEIADEYNIEVRR